MKQNNTIQIWTGIETWNPQNMKHTLNISTMEWKRKSPKMQRNTSVDLKGRVSRMLFCKRLLTNPNFTFPIQFLVLCQNS